MDLILIVLFLVIVVCMGYILCKPFFTDRDDQETANIESYLDIQYQMLLLEIRRIKSECNAGAIQEAECKTQLRKLKNEAVQLLHQLNEEPTELQKIFSQEDLLDLLGEETARGNERFCPQCGEQINTNDKFCVHCGHTL